LSCRKAGVNGDVEEEEEKREGREVKEAPKEGFKKIKKGAFFLTNL
jgi:hypothetical protein